jgi:hypothetical protein
MRLMTRDFVFFVEWHGNKAVAYRKRNNCCKVLSLCGKVYSLIQVSSSAKFIDENDDGLF